MKFQRIGDIQLFLNRTCDSESKSVLHQSLQKNQRLLLPAMASERKKWEEHKATLPLTQGELRMLWSRFRELSIVGTRMGFDMQKS